MMDNDKEVTGRTDAESPAYSSIGSMRPPTVYRQIDVPPTAYYSIGSMLPPTVYRTAYYSIGSMLPPTVYRQIKVPPTAYYPIGSMLLPSVYPQIEVPPIAYYSPCGMGNPQVPPTAYYSPGGMGNHQAPPTACGMGNRPTLPGGGGMPPIPASTVDEAAGPSNTGVIKVEPRMILAFIVDVAGPSNMVIKVEPPLIPASIVEESGPSNTVIVVQYMGGILTVNLALPLLKKLKAAVLSRRPLLKGTVLKFLYKDEEGDMILIACDEDLKLCFEYFKTLNITVKLALEIIYH